MSRIWDKRDGASSAHYTAGITTLPVSAKNRAPSSGFAWFWNVVLLDLA